MPEHATPEGTAAYACRVANRVAPGHFRSGQGLQLSSIGLGTYLGEPDAPTDEAYQAAIRAALECGCNVIDGAINYRFQRSERVIGRALATAIADGVVPRDAVVIATKAGYLPFDSVPPRNPDQWFQDTFVATGVATFDDLVAGFHCMTPAYLRHQLATSLRNLQVHCVDIYYLHNPEAQLAEVPRKEFLARLRAAFAQLEEAVAAGQIRLYGIATWDGLRQPEQARDHLSLPALVQLAQEVAGTQHHFRVIQLPFNLAMPEALTRRNQRIDGEFLSVLGAAERFGITVMASASILQGRLTRDLPPALTQVLSGLQSDAQRAIQFVRSTPGVSTALVGMKQVSHVAENLATAAVAPVAASHFTRFFRNAPSPDERIS